MFAKRLPQHATGPVITIIPQILLPLCRRPFCFGFVPSPARACDVLARFGIVVPHHEVAILSVINNVDSYFVVHFLSVPCNSEPTGTTSNKLAAPFGTQNYTPAEAKYRPQEF